MASYTRQWRPRFEQFLTHMRIDSKEVAAVDERGSPLKMWGSQKMFVDNIFQGLDNDQRMFAFLKARQLGISTISLALDLFWLAVHPGMIGALVTDTEENRDVFRATLKRYINNLPPELVGDEFRLGKNNKSYMTFEPNGQRLDFMVAGKSKATWGEGRGYALAHLTELSKYGNPAGLASFRETLAETHPDRLFIYESTANGSNHWKDICEEAERDTESRFVFIGWWAKDINRIKATNRRYKIYGADLPDQGETEKINEVYKRHNVVIDREQLAWIRWRDSDTSSSPQDKAQNLPWLAEEAFVNTGYSFFQTRLLNQDIDAATNPDNELLYRWKGYRYHLANDFWAIKMEQIRDRERIDEVELKVWDEPVKNAPYVIGCDPAFGRNDWKDRHAISVWRCFADRLVQVAEFATSEVESHHCAWVLAHLAGAYRNCIINLELNGGPGRAVMREWDVLRQQMRSPMYEEQQKTLGWDDPLSQARWYLYHRPDAMGAGYCYNFNSSRDTKYDLMNRIRSGYTTRILWVKSRRMMEEMQNVIQDGSTIGAPGRAKDDRVFAGALAYYAWDEWMRSMLMSQGLSYESVMAKETGEAAIVDQVVDRLVWNYFKKAEEDAANPRRNVEKYLLDRGLA
jgi:hypothetical protein